MRLLSVTINEYRSISGCTVPLEGMVVLFGPNSAGKTTVLEAVRDALSAKRSARIDPGDWDEPFHAAEVAFELPGAGLAGSEDSELLRDLLARKYGPGEHHDAVVPPFDALDREAAELLADCSLEEVTTYLVDALVKTGGAGTLEDRRCFAGALFDNPIFTTDSSYIVLCVSPEQLGSTASAAAARIGHCERIESDTLQGLAIQAITRGTVYVATLSDQARKFLPDHVAVITLDTDPDRLTAEIEAVLPRLHNRLWALERVPHQNEFLAQLGWEREDEFLIGPPDARFLKIDPWVESLVHAPDGPTVATPTTFGPYNTGDWHRVRRSLLAIVQLLSARAN